VSLTSDRSTGSDMEAPQMTTPASAARRAAGIRYAVSAVVGAVFVVILALIASYAWEQHFTPSRASAADCQLAQAIIDQAQRLPHSRAADEAWLTDMHNLRMARMKDGYLGLQVARYEGWAAARATGTGELPTAAEFRDMVHEANSHCATKLTIPAIKAV
jgi:hypothetical protein